MLHYTTAPELTDTYIQRVWEELPRHIRPTLLLPCPELSQRFQCEVTVATETFQYTGSFKFRAAYNLLSSIPHQHIITASSGNFGQAIAYASKLLGKTCTVVMPTTSAQVKVAAVQSYGGQVDLIDVHQVSRAERVAQLLQTQSDAFQAQAYDDYRVIAGNSTLGKEIFSAAPFDSVVVPIGGGGLCSGIAIAIGYMNKQVEIIGAEPIPGNDAAQSLRSGQLVRNEHEPATLADGARTISLGQINWEILRQSVSDIIEVSDTRIVHALQYAFRYINLKVEPTGALSLGALFARPERFAGKRVCCVVSGGNVDPTLYAQALLSKAEEPFHS